jgi:hypothetical protein
VPQTGDLFTGKSGADPAWAKAKRQARALASGCKVDSNTLSFALLLPDGKMLRFDDLANSAIAKRMEAGKSATIYRVQVVGKLENGMVALDSIQM